MMIKERATPLADVFDLRIAFGLLTSALECEALYQLSNAVLILSSGSRVIMHWLGAQGPESRQSLFFLG